MVVVNTCTVTEGADRENRYWIRRLRRENPNARIVVTGCWVARNRKEVEDLAGVDVVLSNEEKPDVVEYVFRGCGTAALQRGEGARAVSLSCHSKNEYPSLSISSFQGHSRAFLKVQDGCNHACSFCKVVLVRGHSRSRPLNQIIEEAKRLANVGYREMVITGIQLGAYGLDLELRLNLVALLEALSRVSGIERIRLSSIEPRDVTPELIQAMREIPGICPHLHIPLQSGDDEILKKMNRRYGRGFYLDLIARLRQEIPEFCLSLDAMAGFPGEEERHFANTLSAIGETRPIRVHAFPYSRREGTRAARFENGPMDVTRERTNRLIAFSTEIARREKTKYVGRTLPVLVEKKAARAEFVQGRTPHYLKVCFQASAAMLGRTVPVRLAALEGDGILGFQEGGEVG